MDFKCLGKKNVIVINGGTNDFDIRVFNVNKNRMAVMTKFMLKYNNTNIILVNIPYMSRYDLVTDSKVNLEIQAIITCGCCGTRSQ
jgi:hypothetical protein